MVHETRTVINQIENELGFSLTELKSYVDKQTLLIEKNAENINEVAKLTTEISRVTRERFAVIERQIENLRKDLEKHKHVNTVRFDPKTSSEFHSEEVVLEK